MQVARAWPAIRAGLVTLAMAVALLDGCPLPTGRHRTQLGDGPRRAIDTLDRARIALLAPFQPIGRHAEIRQRWQLFQGASQRRFRLRVEAAGPGQPFALLFRAGDPAHQAYADILHYRRIRGSWSPSGQNLRGSWFRFTSWLSARVLADHPELERVRVNFERILIGDGGGFTPTGEIVHEQARRRSRPP